MKNVIDVRDFGVLPGTGADATPGVRRALEQCRSAAASASASPSASACASAFPMSARTVLTFPKGTYHFRPDMASELFYFISNHDNGELRRVAFPLVGLRDFVVDGQGSEFSFHGLMTPFVVDSSSSVLVRNLSIDWDRPRYSQGVVVRATNDCVELRISDEYPYAVAQGRLRFVGEGWDEPCWAAMELNPVTKACEYMSGDACMGVQPTDLLAEEIEPGLVRLSGAITRLPKVGNVLVMRNGKRDNPAFFITNSSDVSVTDVTVHHAHGMGLIAQRSTDITLRSFNVALRPGSGRLFTACADATHFVNCKGTVELDGCLFENQLDDPLNIHGMYSRVVERLSDQAILVQLVHAQQTGVEVARPGDEMRFVRRETLQPYAEGVVVACEPLNQQYIRVDFEEPLPVDIRPGDGLENVTWSADLIFRNCTARANRARGLLLSTPGKVLVEDNQISAPGAAILIAGDANYWFESGAVTDVLIRRNTFENCTYVPQWGSSVIDICPEIESLDAVAPSFHRNIRVESNVFRLFDKGVVRARSVDGLVFSGNTFEHTDAYPPHGWQKEAVALQCCRNVQADEVVPAHGAVHP